MKKILVWGATGSLGVYLIDFLYNNMDLTEYEIIAIGRRATSYFKRLGIQYIRLDVNDDKNYSMLPSSNIHAVIHLANLLPARVFDYNPEDYIRINTIGTIKILEYLKRVQGDRIIFTQTYADLSGHFDKEFYLGNHLQRKLNYHTDHTVYAISKIASEDLIEHYHKMYGIKSFVFRLPNIYHYSPEKYYYVNGYKTIISYRYLIDRAIHNLPIEIWGNPSRFRDIVYVKDFCLLILLALISKRTHGHYNVGTGVGTTLKKQIEGIIEIFSSKDSPSEIIYRPDKPNAMQYVMDIESAKSELGYSFRFDYISYLQDYKSEMKLKRFDYLLSD